MDTRRCITFIMGLLASTLSTESTATSLSNFNGFYAGGNIGAAMGQANYQTNPGCVSSAEGGVFCVVSPDPSSVNGSSVAINGSGKISSRSVIGGVEIGHNWSINKAVVGASADISTMNLNKSVHRSAMFPFAFLGSQYSVSESIVSNWLMTVRGRLGLAIGPQLLIYGTGGAAFTSYKVSSSYNDNAVSVDFPGGSGYGHISRQKNGWTAGGGGEWLFAENFSIKAEYLYADFGSVNVLVPLSNTALFTQTMRVKSEFNTSIVRLGLNYQFG